VSHTNYVIQGGLTLPYLTLPLGWVPPIGDTQHSGHSQGEVVGYYLNHTNQICWLTRDRSVHPRTTCQHWVLMLSAHTASCRGRLHRNTWHSRHSPAGSNYRIYHHIQNNYCKFSNNTTTQTSIPCLSI